MAITHILFDMDGLLLDTERFYTVAQEEICARYGVQFSYAIKAKMMGQKALEAAKIFVKELGLENQLTPEDFLTQRETILDTLFPTATLLPGAERLLRHLHACGVPIAVATSSHTRHFNAKTSSHGDLFSLFCHVTTGDAVSRGKPAPDIFLHAAQRWDPVPPPERCLVFEDAPSGVAAAKAAGMKCVLVPDPQMDSALHAGADEVIASLTEFDPEKYGLPPFSDA